MPLVAYLDGERIDATKKTSQDWDDLQASEERKRLKMPLCGVRAVAKARGLTQFFAHFRLADCTVEHQGETPQHLAMKAALAAYIDSVPNWSAWVEYPHPSQEWIIDVLAVSDDGRRYAFEVQLSSQSHSEYSRRSQRYFDSGAFPVWLVPQDLEYHPIKIPVVVTGFGKSSEVPDDPSTLLELETEQEVVRGDHDLRRFLERLLTFGPDWAYGAPDEQTRKIAAERKRQETARQAEAAKQAEYTRMIEETNRNSASPEAAYGAHTIQTEDGPFVWATLNQCWKCRHPMLLWEARGPKSGKPFVRVPTLQVKGEVDQKRYENHPDVHRLVDRWMRETKADVDKAVIDKRKSQAKGSIYSAFVCPSCSALIGQIFVSCIRNEKWAIISAPKIRETDVERARRTPAVHRPQTDRPSRVRQNRMSDAQWAKEVRDRIDRGPEASGSQDTPAT
ncbi:competence protein CoiA [Crystallibacter degradans]|uniref:competence protein CoiA n=1 Tax=Crystallibacter degradans TaxID=2726743 RepID=UPI0014742E3C|nr:competence protein CoiA family protein [Arthrobacter sp. SF27]NMR30917.1 hypothetical protein [Arthrobacter sp. SF27]